MISLCQYQTHGAIVTPASVTTYLDITCSAVQIQVQVLDLSEVRKLVVQVLLTSFFVYVCDDDDPAFNGADGGRIRVGGHREVLRVMFVVGFWGEGRIDLHFGVRHDVGLK